MHRIRALLATVALAAACKSTTDDGTKEEQGSRDAASSEGDAEPVDGDTAEDWGESLLCPLTHPERLSGECPENYVCEPLRRDDGTFCARRVLTYQDCRTRGGEVMGIPDAGESECPEPHVYIGVAFENMQNPAHCCEPIESHCAANDAIYEGSSPCEANAEQIEDVQWDGQACVRKAGCTCVGADCLNGMSMSDCERSYSVCAHDP
mgnify:CR=1 FL=1